VTIGVGVIGYGYWGPNLVRNFMATADAKVVGVAERRADVRAAIARSVPGVGVYESEEELIARDDVDAVVIATPVSTHYPLAKAALAKGKHVLVEKPLASSSAEVEDLIARAEKAGRVLMVDHTFLFTGAVQAMTQLVRRGELGTVCYIDSTRVNLGLFQPDVNCLWDLAPHDLSIIDQLIGSDIVAIDATGYGHIDPMRPDMVFLTLHYANKQVAHFNLSWMSPVKVRRFTVGGTKKMLVWDDLDQDQKIKIYDHGIEFQSEDQRKTILPEYRIGDIYSPLVSRKEALTGVANHFIQVIRGQAQSIMDGQHGLRVVKILEASQAQLDKNLRLVASQRQTILGGAAS
jgi:predicted dehydrogenase